MPELQSGDLTAQQKIPLERVDSESGAVIISLDELLRFNHSFNQGLMNPSLEGSDQCERYLVKDISIQGCIERNRTLDLATDRGSLILHVLGPSRRYPGFNGLERLTSSFV